MRTSITAHVTWDGLHDRVQVDSSEGDAQRPAMVSEPKCLAPGG
jgi:hypothetical protein